MLDELRFRAFYPSPSRPILSRIRKHVITGNTIQELLCCLFVISYTKVERTILRIYVVSLERVLYCPKQSGEYADNIELSVTFWLILRKCPQYH